MMKVIIIIGVIAAVLLCSFAVYFAHFATHGRRQTFEESWGWQMEWVPHLNGTISRNDFIDYVVKDKYGLDEHGYFGEATRTRARIYRSENPIDDSIDFYKNISSGGVEEELTNGRGVKSTLDDGTVITHRIVTSTPDSPAVDINIESPAFIKPQKIHFVYERK